MGRPGAVAPGVLRRKTDADPQGRCHCRQSDGRRQRVDPNPAAGALPPMFASYGGSLHATSLTFISQAAQESGLPDALGLKKKSPWSKAAAMCRKPT